MYNQKRESSSLDFHFHSVVFVTLSAVVSFVSVPLSKQLLLLLTLTVCLWSTLKQQTVIERFIQNKI